MSGFLLDTNCISEAVRVNPEPRVLAWIEAADESLLYLSVLTFGEIRKGIAALPQGRRRTRLEAWLEVELRARFLGRILSIDGEIADRWGLLAAGAMGCSDSNDNAKKTQSASQDLSDEELKSLCSGMVADAKKSADDSAASNPSGVASTPCSRRSVAGNSVSSG